MKKKSVIEIKLRAAYISLFIGFGMLLAKFSAYFLTGSSAIFSDAAESIVHVMATSMALYSIILSSKPPDKSHLYGHGNIEYFSAGIEGLFIIIAAIVIVYTAIEDIISQFQPTRLDFGTMIVGFAGLVNLILGRYLIRKGKATKSLVLIADGKHVLTDAYTSAGVVAGLTLVLFTDLYILDPIIAIVVALNILLTGSRLIRESVGGLMNETDRGLLNKMTEKLISIKQDFYIDIHQFRFWKSAEKVFIDFHLTLPYYFTIKESHASGKR